MSTLGPEIPKSPETVDPLGTAKVLGQELSFAYTTGNLADQKRLGGNLSLCRCH